MLTKFNFTALAASLIGVVLATSSCGNQPHPNQINAFDGATYDSLTLARGALAALRAPISSQYTQYTQVFNQAAATYSVAYDAYALFRTSPGTQANVAIAIGNLTVSIVALEHAVESDMQVPATQALAVRKQAARIRKAAGANTSVADILTELEIAAAIAQGVDPSQPYSGLALVVIDATNQALAAKSASAGQPIDLNTIQPVPSIQ
ncbi:MAG TPA: hypothetical protein VFB14_11735 [Bryobacteraceae bacterium]|jgi:hypothetical protein|nr:hypothetical protein [Bryobacteraceae bacterium]